MIHELLPVVAGELNDFFQARFGTNEDKVVLGNIVEQDGTIAVQEPNKLIVSLINIERDGSKMGYGTNSYGGPPPVHINLYVMFGAYFEQNNYAEALKFISGVVGFFQANPIWDSSTCPELDDHVSSTSFEVFNIDFRELSNLWATIGAKYIPSVIYRVRTLDMDEGNIHDDIPAIEGITI